MNILILEDDTLSVESLSKLLSKNNIKANVKSINTEFDYHTLPLANSKTDKTNSSSPDLSGARAQNDHQVILTSAYEKYAIIAFKVNQQDNSVKSIDFEEPLVLPLTYDSVSFSGDKVSLNKKNDEEKSAVKKYKIRFLVKVGNSISFKNINEVAYFFADDKTVYLVGYDGKKYIVDYKIEQLENLLDATYFHRINRKFIVNIAAIQKMKIQTNNRMQVFLMPSFEQEIFISKEKVSEFKAWLDS